MIICQRFFCTLSLFLMTTPFAFSQIKTNTDVLRKAAVIQAENEKLTFNKLLVLSKQKGWDMIQHGKDGNISMLVDIDEGGFPIYLTTHNNIISAATIKTNLLWPGGSTGLSLSGSSANMIGKLAIWEGGSIRRTHVEMTNRVIQKDAPTVLNDNHSTHVAGTLIAAGVNPAAKGMSFGAQQLIAYDFTNDESEMMTEAPNLLLSNHSYGAIAGWRYNDLQARWEFNGRPDAIEDYKFGYYGSDTQIWDSIAYNAPYYLIVKSAGNARNSNGPAVGSNYWRPNSSGTMIDAGNRPAGISSNDGYDIVSFTATGKNVLTVGAVNPIPSGYNQPGDVAMSSFSAWGPTDDGRIKPDVVTDGIGVLSTVGSSDNAYSSLSGTSMATPAATGSLFLLQEYYSKLHSGGFMRAATLKGLVIHAADEAGTSPGPDYQFGWGLINIEKAANIIKSANTTDLIIENNLTNGSTFTQSVVATGNGPLIATISWTDPKGIVENGNILNSTSIKLVHDLDIRVTSGTTTYRPWILDPAAPSAAATTGDNFRDNVEKVVITDVIPGQTYTITVSHKNSLQRGQQAYSLIVSGVGGQIYCTSAASSTGGTRIDKTVIGNINNTNAGNCTSYTNYKNLTLFAQANQTLPISVQLKSCDATVTDKIVKVYIDYNSDGDFVDAGEIVAQSAVVNGDATYTGSIVIPPAVVPGNFSVMRIVAQETNNAANVNPCGAYSNGETQDYRIQFLSPSDDVGITELLSPQSGSCANSAQYVTVRIKNFGSLTKTNVPVSAVVSNGAGIIANLSGTYFGNIEAGASVLYVFPTAFNAVEGTSYTVSSSTLLAGDQKAQNDQYIAIAVIDPNAAGPAGTGVICSNTVTLKATSPNNSLSYFWYDSPTGNTIIATGSTAVSNIITTDKNYYLSTGIRASAGLSSRTVYPGQGGYLSLANSAVYVNYTANVPLVLESAKLYTGNSGKVTLIVADITNITSTGFSYTTLSTTTFDVYATSPSPTSGNRNPFNPADVGGVFDLKIALPAGDHSIIIKTDANATIGYNNNVSGNPYPFITPGLFALKSNSIASTATPPDPNYYQGFYLGLYDLKIRTAECTSARTTITATTASATAPVITLTGNILTSSFATGNQWYLNGGIIAGATGKTYAALLPGVYKAVSNDPSGCLLTSNEINFVPTPVVDLNGADIKLVVSPNPSHGIFNLQMEFTTKNNLHISLLNTVGQEMYRNTYPDFVGKLSREVNPGKLAAGVYFLKIEHGKKLYLKKLIITD